jgi:hypothetical protein
MLSQMWQGALAADAGPQASEMMRLNGELSNARRDLMRSERLEAAVDRSQNPDAERAARQARARQAQTDDPEQLRRDAEDQATRLREIDEQSARLREQVTDLDRQLSEAEVRQRSAETDQEHHQRDLDSNNAHIDGIEAAARRAAEVASQLTLLARDCNNLRAEVIAQLEAATHLAVGDRGAQSLPLLRGAIQRAAAGPPALQAQAELVSGQVLLRAGQPAEARRAWRSLLSQSERVPADIEGRAALYSGRHLAEQNHPAEAAVLLDRARARSHDARDWPAYGPALILLLRAAVESSQRERTGALLREGRAAAAAFGGPEATAALQRFIGWLSSTWGKDTVDALLRRD